MTLHITSIVAHGRREYPNVTASLHARTDWPAGLPRAVVHQCLQCGNTVFGEWKRCSSCAAAWIAGKVAT